VDWVNILIRTDASTEIGSGHVIRCYTLANSLRERGSNVSFVCRETSGDLCDFLEENGFSVFRLKREIDLNTDAIEVCNIMKQERKVDWLIVDHYNLDERFEKLVKPYHKKLMVIDDLANRNHDCDLLVDQNLVDSWQDRYDKLVQKKCIKLLGPEFALLRQEFKKERMKTKIRTGNVRRILVFLGGGDPTNITMKALKAISLLNRDDIKIDVVVGSSNPHKEMLKEYCSKTTNLIYHLQTNQMASLMNLADISIGGGGSSTWERCCLGLPSIVITLADNQKLITKKMHDIGAIYNLGDGSEITIFTIYHCLKDLMNQRESLQKMSQICFGLIDGEGTRRVVNYLMKESGED
jgi:UDP-2,4-diacetamido-2,4,6-trideoxy-beta-L-altropyranose hydrolase